MSHADAMSTAEDVHPGAPRRGGGRDAITAAARASFAERGYHGTSIRDIARLAGLSLSALYYWHPSKQHLLAALMEEITHDYFQRCDLALREVGDDPAERLCALVRVTVEYRVSRRVESNIANLEWRNLEPENRERLAGLRRGATRLWADIIDDGVARGVFGCPHPDDARRAVVAACNAIVQWYEPDGDIAPQELAERYTGIALRIVDHRG
ncbi:TetR family transcriptional regulator [Pseudonocardia autotrophica]|uniref:HTH-type transcriptional repressor KstR2 n=2 Tax=Pseudonocardiaceae TaxID=2070 RepID=A0A1Y2N798_PSEAH|nr:HTH-type transcriptional repressor KstR2 [Pseudonocardia autotrophica]TDN71832.1 TetR family transcriptional regulator [Pseudonocardia autotrophica]BBG02520.1 TetR family transcriptional regulator [Pseudonocardia autotrophica]